MSVSSTRPMVALSSENHPLIVLSLREKRLMTDPWWPTHAPCCSHGTWCPRERTRPQSEPQRAWNSKPVNDQQSTTDLVQRHWITEWKIIFVLARFCAYWRIGRQVRSPILFCKPFNTWEATKPRNYDRVPRMSWHRHFRSRRWEPPEDLQESLEPDIKKGWNKSPKKKMSRQRHLDASFLLAMEVILLTVRLFYLRWGNRK